MGTPMTDATTLLRRRSTLLLGLTVAWNAIEAAVAVGAGLAAGSIALVGFGLDSVIEVFAAIVALWHLNGAAEEREQRALRLVAISFFALAAYVTIASVRDLATGTKASESSVGIALAIVSLVVMPTLAIAKRRTGRRLGSATLVSESAGTMLCSYLSAAVLVGLVLNATLGWWWADPLSALVVAALALREGREAWNGDPCCAAG